MSDTTILSVRLSRELRERLSVLGDSTGRSKSFLAAEAIADYVEPQEWQLKAIEEGRAEADAGGPFYDHEQVRDWLLSGGPTKSPIRRNEGRLGGGGHLRPLGCTQLHHM